MSSSSPPSIPGGFPILLREEMFHVLKDFVTKDQWKETVNELEQLKDEVKSLKKMKGDKEDPFTKALKNSIEYLKEGQEYEAVRIIFTQVFTDLELATHSVTGQASNKQHNAKPLFDLKKYGLATEVLFEKYPQLRTSLTPKIHSIIKGAKRRLDNQGKEGKKDKKEKPKEK